MKQLYCDHYITKFKKTDCFSFHLISARLNICKECYDKLKWQILEQIKIEKEIEDVLNIKNG